jgi:hypothetical protein
MIVLSLIAEYIEMKKYSSSFFYSHFFCVVVLLSLHTACDATE